MIPGQPRLVSARQIASTPSTPLCPLMNLTSGQGNGEQSRDSQDR